MAGNTSDDSAEHMVQVFIEHMEDKFAAMHEGLDGMLETRLKPIQDDLAEVKSDTKVIKAAVTDLSKDQRDLEGRVGGLEARAA